jgi:hypothetical protein
MKKFATLQVAKCVLETKIFSSTLKKTLLPATTLALLVIYVYAK